MFRCQECRSLVKPGTKAHFKIVKTRRKVYPFRPRANVIRIEGENVVVPDNGGVGVETVKELVVCPACASKPLLKKAS